MSTADNRRIHLRGWLVLPVLLGVGYLLFWPSFDSAWLMDDFAVLVKNPDIRSLANFFENYYPGRPLRELTFLLDYQFFGLQPAGYHVQQIFWHALNAWLIFLLAKRLNACTPLAFGAALLFLVHPVQVEVVANISHRKDSLALAFCLASLLAYLRGRHCEHMQRVWWLLAAILFWGVALLAKQNALALVALPVVYELGRPDRNHRKTFLVAIVLGVVAVIGRVVYLIHNQEFLNNIGSALIKLGNIGRVSPEDYFLTMFKAWAFMVSKLVWPVNLTMEYTFTTPEGWQDPWVLSGILVGIVLIVLFCWSRSRSQTAYLALGWLLVFWLPTSNLLGHLSYFAADRYWYSPLTGVCLLFCVGLWRLCRQKQAVFLAMICLVLAPLALLTWQQQKVWKNAESLNAHMLRVSPTAMEGLVGKGVLSMDAGDFAVAEHYFQQAARLSPSDWRISQSLGLIAYRQQRYDVAQRHFQRAIEMLQRTIEVGPRHVNVYNNMGVIYEHMGKLAESETMLRRALAELWEYPEAHYNLGVTLYRAQRLDEARESFAQAVRLSPEDGDALFNYGLLAGETGHGDEAAIAVERLRAIDSARATQLEQELSGR